MAVQGNANQIQSAADAAKMVESAKKKAAYAAVDEYVRDNMVCLVPLCIQQ
jgi:hypothetical protein